jgi:release factor glutamine methyltransferase
MDSLRRIVREVGGFTRPSGLVALEVGMSQAGEVAALLEATRQYDDVRVKRDLSGRERIVLATRAAAPGPEPN